MCSACKKIQSASQNCCSGGCGLLGFLVEEIGPPVVLQAAPDRQHGVRACDGPVSFRTFHAQTYDLLARAPGHADLIPEHVRATAPKGRRGRREREARADA